MEGVRPGIALVCVRNRSWFDPRFALKGRLPERLNLLRIADWSSHPVFRMPPVATSWASYLDDVVYLEFHMT